MIVSQQHRERPVTVKLPACFYIACWMVIITLASMWIGWGIREFNAAEDRRILRSIDRRL